MSASIRTVVVPGVCEISQSGLPSDGRRLLIEIPHGATERAHYDALFSRLVGTYPMGLEKFFHVNTDVAAPELAQAIAADPALEGTQVTIVRSLIPRTFIDCNRTVGGSSELYRQGGVTPATPDYVGNAADLALLHGLLAEYQSLAGRAYEAVCGEGGVALMLHTYAPRTVPILSVGHDIVEQLELHYAPEQIENCALRPEIDFITRTPDADAIIDPRAVAGVTTRLRDSGRVVAEGASYPLHPSTAAFHFARRYRGRTLCIEVRRDLLVEEWNPFEPMRADAGKVAPLASALARGLSEWLSLPAWG